MSHMLMKPEIVSDVRKKRRKSKTERVNQVEYVISTISYN